MKPRSVPQPLFWRHRLCTPSGTTAEVLEAQRVASKKTCATGRLATPAHKERETQEASTCTFYPPQSLYSSSVRLTKVALRSTSLAKSFSNSTVVTPTCSARWRTTSRHATVSSRARCAWRPQQLQIRDKHCKRAHPSPTCCPQQRTTCNVST